MFGRVFAGDANALKRSMIAGRDPSVRPVLRAGFTLEARVTSAALPPAVITART